MRHPEFAVTTKAQLLTSILADINPKATDTQVLRAGHWCVAGFAIFMAAFGSMLHGVNIDLGFIYVSGYLPVYARSLNMFVN